MDNQRDLKLVLNGRAPLVLIETSDESRLLDMMKTQVIASDAARYRPLYRWTVTDGLQRLDIDLEPQIHNSEPKEALRHIRAVKQPGTYVLLDFHPFLEDPVHVRLIKDICLDFRRCERYLVIVGHSINLPDELTPFCAKLEMALPDEAERERIVRAVAENWANENPGRKVKTDKGAYQLLIRNLAGLTDNDTERLAHNAIYDDGAIRSDDLNEVMKAKYDLLNRDVALSYEYETAKFSDVGGLLRLKQWLEERRSPFLQKAGAAHLDPPKGVLLIGVQGCGKSLAAKATAGVYGVPLLRLDFGSLYNKYHGETERNLRESLKLASVMAPCVLWIDEIEKGIASGSDESGTAQRVLGTFLTWLSERAESVFVVATANDISALPPELVRKGRFDEIFFVDLPGRRTRKEIFALHLKSRQLTVADFNLDQLVDESEGFSGAEIEQSVAAARYTAHARDQALSTALIAEEIARTRPLSVTMAERVRDLRRWAEHRAVPCD